MTAPTKNLAILKASLEKKTAKFDAKLQDHFDTVASANGQPLNDKGAKGRATLAQWDRQNDTLHTLNAGIELTAAAIERETHTIDHVARVRAMLPTPIIAMLDAGTLTQWRKYPHILFVAGVDLARIKYDTNTKQLTASHFSGIKDKAMYAIFRDAFNKLKAELSA